MPSKILRVIATFRAKVGLEEIVQNELSSLLSPTRQEAGCIQYDLHQAMDDPKVFVFYEIWKSKQALDDHLAKPYLQSLIGKVAELFDVPPEIRFLDKLD